MLRNQKKSPLNQLKLQQRLLQKLQPRQLVAQNCNNCKKKSLETKVTSRRTKKLDIALGKNFLLQSKQTV